MNCLLPEFFRFSLRSVKVNEYIFMEKEMFFGLLRLHLLVGIESEYMYTMKREEEQINKYADIAS